MFKQGLDQANIVAEALKKIARHKRDNPALGLTVLDLGVINSEHFPFNVTGYSFAKTSPGFAFAGVLCSAALWWSAIVFVKSGLCFPGDRCGRLTAQVIEGLAFAPSIKLLAKDIIARTSNNGQHMYKSLHLRFEADALSAWALEDSARQVSTSM